MHKKYAFIVCASFVFASITADQFSQALAQFRRAKRHLLKVYEQAEQKDQADLKAAMIRAGIAPETIDAEAIAVKSVTTKPTPAKVGALALQQADLDKITPELLQKTRAGLRKVPNPDTPKEPKKTSHLPGKPTPEELQEEIARRALNNKGAITVTVPT